MILVLSEKAKAYEAVLAAELGDKHRVVYCRSVSELSASQCNAVEVVLADPGLIAPHFAQLPNVKWVQSTFAGVDAIIKQGLPHGVVLTNIRGVFGQAMAEYVFAQLISLERHLPSLHRQQNSKQWQPLEYKILAGRRLLLLGTGSIAQSIAGIAKAFAMEVEAVSRSGQAKAEFDAVYPVAKLNERLNQANYVVSVLPSTNDTQHLIAAPQFKAMLADAVLVNVGRGAVVDEAALLDALNTGQLRHAVLDVFEQEPLPQDSALWSHPKVTLTPHCAAVSFPHEIADVFIHNLNNWLSGKALNYIVDVQVGY